jgi:hypothetical protein
MSNLLNTCNTFFEQQVPECITALDVDLGLDAGEIGYWNIQDKFGKEYVGTYLADGNGKFTIELYPTLPEGSFNRFSGTYLLTIKKRLEYCNNKTFEICGVEYDAIAITPTYSYPCDSTIKIPCEC